jgi:hypothetical protein
MFFKAVLPVNRVLLLLHSSVVELLRMYEQAIAVIGKPSRSTGNMEPENLLGGCLEACAERGCGLY